MKKYVGYGIASIFIGTFIAYVIILLFEGLAGADTSETTYITAFAIIVILVFSMFHTNAKKRELAARLDEISAKLDKIEKSNNSDNEQE